MLRPFFRLHRPLGRGFAQTSMTLNDVMQFKRTKIYPEAPDKWFDQDKEDIKKILKSEYQNKRYLRIQNDWKNNLIKKEKKRLKRIELQKQLTIVPEDPKLIVHR